MIWSTFEVSSSMARSSLPMSSLRNHRAIVGSGTLEWLSLQVLSPLCDILGCALAELITTTA
ncbi:helix-turn-helix domain-containing protein [Dactylosporangium aurantiacum]|uniref:helix-turn-helix domain-containing protein n=1 Tax=Dactylosporangium aurantiacum TaxID=35754 RepID=UPI001FE136FC|nr:helix-turn-helix domain-containing protein [Dactylosporangium aurantiacum]MDG6105194.1 helix-turn-helix domain-containing protein [Dactylosporangium aurantiacum]